MKLAAVLACRNKSSRLYAKPLQNLDVKKCTTILDHIVAQLKMSPEIEDIVLAVSEEEENSIYKKYSKSYETAYVQGDDEDVLSRLIKGAESVHADHVFRVSTESPYLYLENLSGIYQYHCEHRMDYSVTKGLPDGAYFEIIRLDALKKSWENGEARHRSELCTLYISENKESFKIVEHEVPEKLRRNDVRLTVDWPEDLIVMRKIYEDLQLSPDKQDSLEAIIDYLDAHPKINSINNWIDSGIGRIWY